MRLKTLFNTAVVGSIALGMIACNQKERVDELSAGTYVEMSNVELIENNLPTSETEHETPSGDFLQDQNTSEHDVLATIVVAKDKNSLTQTIVYSPYTSEAESADLLNITQYEMKLGGDQEHTYSTGVVDYTTTFKTESVEAYHASKVKKDSEKDKDKDKDKETEKETKEKVAKTPKQAVEDITPEKRFSKTLIIRAVAPQIIAVNSKERIGKSDGTSSTLEHTYYYKYVVAPQMEEINKAFNAKLVAKKSLAMAKRNRIEVEERAAQVAEEVAQENATETAEGQEAIKQTQESLEVANEKVAQAEEDFVKKGENLEEVKKILHTTPVEIPPVSEDVEGNDQ